MSARRKKQRRLRDLRTLVLMGEITRVEADAIGATEGLGPVGLHRPRKHRLPQPGSWAWARSREARACR